jgi:molybdenum cofactor sulfurtransferase
MLGKPTGVVRVSLGAMSIAGDVRTLLEFLDEVYVNVNNQHLSISTRHASTIIAPTSPKASQDMSNRPLSPLIHSTIFQSSASASNPPDSRSSDRPFEAQAEDRPKAPPFVPADYVKLRKPWEEEMRKNAAVYAQEMKAREVEDANTPRNQTPSVKARKFGRSVVNLLRTKSHYSDAR